MIVEFDLSCQAPDHWYLKNQTQPDRDQPWYHVLVDGSQQVTYVAESNLKHDQTGKPVVHGMLNLFFSGYDDVQNKYQRNDVPWNPEVIHRMHHHLPHRQILLLPTLRHLKEF